MHQKQVETHYADLPFDSLSMWRFFLPPVSKRGLWWQRRRSLMELVLQFVAKNRRDHAVQTINGKNIFWVTKTSIDGGAKGAARPIVGESLNGLDQIEREKGKNHRKRRGKKRIRH